MAHSTVEEMESGILDFLQSIAAEYQITPSTKYAPNCFNDVLKLLHAKTGRQVVVLVDEYDMPILDALGKPSEVTESIRQFLQSFYKILKSADEHLRFLFLTGVSKFAKVSIFSGLNNLYDITMDASYSTICGYTQAELEGCFGEHIEALASAEQTTRVDIIGRIKNWYNGYSWDGVTSVYNPFSTLSLFRGKSFEDYWFASGTPSFLIDLVKERNDVKPLLEATQMKSSELNSFDYRTMDVKLLAFQTGYLTVKSSCRRDFNPQLTYTLGIPNEEVRQALMCHLVSCFANYPMSNTDTMRDRMLQQLLDGDITAFENSMREMFANIPYHLHIQIEAYYHSLLLCWLNLLGFEVQAEVSTDKGRIDAVWTWKDKVFVAEIKFAAKGKAATLLKAAFAQIKKNRYYERYQDGKKHISLLAVAFAGKEIVCKMEEL
jgi:hypothetical protein